MLPGYRPSHKVRTIAINSAILEVCVIMLKGYKANITVLRYLIWKFELSSTRSPDVLSIVVCVGTWTAPLHVRMARDSFHYRSD